MHDTFLGAMKCTTFTLMSCVMNFIAPVGSFDANYILPLLHVLQFVSLFIAIGAGLATMSITFKNKADGLVKRFFDLFK